MVLITIPYMNNILYHYFLYGNPSLSLLFLINISLFWALISVVKKAMIIVKKLDHVDMFIRNRGLSLFSLLHLRIVVFCRY